jgi:hypothetical protein
MGSQLLDDVLEEAYVAGFNCTDEQRLAQIVESEERPAGVTANALATKYIGMPGLFARPAMPQTGAQPSSTAGALESWLALHEAGHAIVAVRGGLPVRGVRFFEPNGFPGETGIVERGWNRSMDAAFLQRLVRIAVAGNVAQIIWEGCKEPEGGQLSKLYDDLTGGNRPTDFIMADARAARVTYILGQWNGKAPIPKENWAARRAVLVQAEAEAETTLRADMDKLRALAERLQRGPVRGSEIRAVIG